MCPAGDCNDEFLSQSPLVLLSSHFTIPDPLCSTFHKQIKINKQWHENWEGWNKSWEMYKARFKMFISFYIMKGHLWMIEQLGPDWSLCHLWLVIIVGKCCICHVLVAPYQRKPELQICYWFVSWRDQRYSHQKYKYWHNWKEIVTLTLNVLHVCV